MNENVFMGRELLKLFELIECLFYQKHREKKWATVAYRVNGKQEDYSY